MGCGLGGLLDGLLVSGGGEEEEEEEEAGLLVGLLLGLLAGLSAFVERLLLTVVTPWSSSCEGKVGKVPSDELTAALVDAGGEEDVLSGGDVRDCSEADVPWIDELD